MSIAESMTAVSVFGAGRGRLHVEEAYYNLPSSTLYEHSVRFEKGASITRNGALIVDSGDKATPAPKDRRVVQNNESEKDVWWGPLNIPCDLRTFASIRQRAIDYLNTRERLYYCDGFAGWHPRYRIKVRVICSLPHHALFLNIMFIPPDRKQLATFGQPDFTIYDAGAFLASRLGPGMGSPACVALSLEDREMVILGSEDASEIRKGIFTAAGYLAPKLGVLPMHCSATANQWTGRSSLWFGLNGTDKTTLSANPEDQLIGDHEHCWCDDGIFNLEAGCYDKALNLAAESDPDILPALRFGALLERSMLQENLGTDCASTRLIRNTRGAYPIKFIHNAKIPCQSGHPIDVIFLACDAFGVLPPVSRLSQEQAVYHFISGYSAQLPGLDTRGTEPEAIFSPCFGGSDLVWNPAFYARLLSARIERHGARLWLVNTGWMGGVYRAGRRISPENIRAIIASIHSGALVGAKTQRDPVFGLEVLNQCPGVPSEILQPRDNWFDKAAYDATAKKLAGSFRENFSKYEASVSSEIGTAGPV